MQIPPSQRALPPIPESQTFFFTNLLLFLAWHVTCFEWRMTTSIMDHPILLKQFSRWGGLILLGAIVSVILLMILPLPLWLMDFFLALNLVAALTLLVIAISIHRSTQLSAFPSLILVATLFRLGLNIASTRMVLSKGEAGAIIHTFGEFATGGSLLVGGIMFLIVTIIQFLVIAKGSERVAEVAARFTLDAMPGKQMSIDADLRAGVITQTDAVRLRDALQTEYKLYGAMDGAMKFVKGDAIAGLLITVINLLGGWASGVMTMGMSMTQAAATYSILSIGDGLVNQIPALLVSITAGFVITRVADDKNPASMGAEIGRQLFSNPKAIAVAGVLALLMGLIPGFPFFLFFLIGAALFGIAFAIHKTFLQKARADASIESLVLHQTSLEHTTGSTRPLILEVGPELFHIFLKDPRWQAFAQRLYPMLQAQLSLKMGVPFPDLKLKINPALSGSFRYQIQVHEATVRQGMLRPHHCVAPSEISVPTGIEAPQSANTYYGTPVALWDVKRQTVLEQSGMAVMGPEFALLKDLAKTLEKHAEDFLGIQEVQNLLDALSREHPKLVDEVIHGSISVVKLTDILKRLVGEGIPIRDLRLILQCLSQASTQDRDPVTLTDMIRADLKRSITTLYTDGRMVEAFHVDPDIEDEIVSAIRVQGMECILSLDGRRIQEIRDLFEESILPVLGNKRALILVHNPKARRYLKKLIEDVLPEAVVLGSRELTATLKVKSLGIISFSSDSHELPITA
jgi:type III secretion protein V